MDEILATAFPVLFVGRTVRRSTRRAVYPTTPRLSGTGYLAGEFPGGITSVEGVPSAAEVRVLSRTPGGESHLVATTMSGPDGTWRVDGLNTKAKYDVVGRKDGFNDVIMSNVSPVAT